MTRSQPTPPTYADLEIRILDRQAAGYPVELTVAGRQLPRGFLDPTALPLPWVHSADPAADGERLMRWLLADPAVKEAWDRVNGLDGYCRIRLRMDAAAPELHAVPWELLRQPAGLGATAHDLAASDKTPFSRYLALPNPPGRPIVDERLRVLVAIADPDNLAKYQLTPIDRATEIAALEAAVAGLPVELTGLTGPCTLPAIEKALRRGYHVLHFVGHGAYVESAGAALYLAGDANQVSIARAEKLADMLARLAGPDNALQLVFLGSCQTAVASPADAFRGLAPQLLQAGIPAVLAMQDLVPVLTYRAFAQAFYRQLMQHGAVDLAANQARAALLTAKLPGAAIPVLFMRLPDGQLLVTSERASGPAPLAGHPTPPLAPELIGRDRFLDDLVAELIQPGGAARLALTALRGLPGVGKTALALALANRPDVAAAFPDGRAWLPLGPQPDVFSTMGRLLEQFGASGQTLLTVAARADLLRSLLAGRRYLLVLDDVWQAGDGRPFVEACASPGRALLTTRFPQVAADLHAANHEVRVLQPKHAVAMLRSAGDHAAAAVDADAAAAAALAQDLGYLPLALHVAGRRLERLSRADGPAGAAARLRGEVAQRVLTLRAAERWLGVADAEPSLEGILALSYDVLDEDARRALRRLAVFGGQPLDFDASAMAAVWEVDEDAATDLRIALVDSGLLERVAPEDEEASQPARGVSPRYSLHQVIAAFASARLAADPAEKRAAALHHAQHYGRVVGGYDNAIRAGRMTYDKPLEWENVAWAVERLIGDWATDDEAAATLLTYARSWRNVVLNNYDLRRMRWLRAAADAARNRGTQRDQANTLKAIGDVQNFRDEREAALESYRQALDLFRAVGDRLGEANTLKAIGDVQNFRDEREAALESYRQALDLFRAVGDRLGEANTLLSLGDILRDQKEYDSAWERYVEVGKLYGAIGDRYSLARVLYRMGDWYTEQDQRQPAAELYRQAIDLWRSIGVDELVESILLPRLQAVT